MDCTWARASLCLCVGWLLGCGDDSSTSTTEEGGATQGVGTTSDEQTTTDVETNGSSGQGTGGGSVGGSTAGTASAGDSSSGGRNLEPDGVFCLGAPGDDCAVGLICCESVDEIACVEDDADCTISAIVCDGPEDCPGATCCGVAGGTECASPCEGIRLCHEASDCGPGEGCCPIGGGVPLGALTYCLALEPGAACPMPP